MVGYRMLHGNDGGNSDLEKGRRQSGERIEPFGVSQTRCPARIQKHERGRPAVLKDSAKHTGSYRLFLPILIVKEEDTFSGFHVEIAMTNEVEHVELTASKSSPESSNRSSIEDRDIDLILKAPCPLDLLCLQSRV